MEARKVQQTGRATFVISLPKSWALGNGIDAGSLIYVAHDSDGTLKVSVQKYRPEPKVVLNIDKRGGEPLIRDLIGCYLSGYRIVELVSKNEIYNDQKIAILQVTDRLIGQEIVEETASRVVIHYLLDSEGLHLERALKKIKALVKSVVQDSVLSLRSHQRDVSLDVIQRDEDVDRLALLSSHQFTEILRSGPLKVADLDSVTAFNYMQVALNLERIADHASRIAWISMDLPGPFTALNPDQEALLDLEPALKGLIEKSISSLLLVDAERANQVIEKAGDILKAVNFTVVSPGIRGADDGLANSIQQP